MSEIIYSWPALIQSSDTVSGYFNTPVSDITFTSIRDCFTEMSERLKDAIDVQISSDTGYYIMGTAGYEASKILAEKGLDAVYDKLKDRMDSDGEDINDYIITHTAGNVIQTIWKRSYQSSYELVNYSANLTFVHKDDFISMINGYSFTNNSYSVYSATYRYFHNSNSRMTYTHKQYQARISSYNIGPTSIASDGGYSSIYNGTTISVTNAGSNIYVQSIMGGHIEGTGTSTGSSSLYTSSCGAIFSNVLCTSRELYNPNGSDTSTSGKYPSSSMGGLGTFDDSTDLSDISSKPSLNLASLGFFSVWNPSDTQLVQLADFVWNNPMNVSQWPQLFQSGIIKPMDYIISLSLFPLSSSQLSLSNETFCMGGILFDGDITHGNLGMTISMNKVKEQFIDIDMGTVDLKEYFGSFLDYAPYSQVSLYLPYYQTVQLSMNEVQNADSIHIVYRINLLDGSTAIKVHVDRQTNSSQNGSVPLKHVLYEYFTNLKTEIPLTSGANTEQLKMLATVMAGAAAVVAAPIAGAGASALAGGIEGATAGGGMAGAMAGAQAGNQAVGQAVSGAIKTGAGAANKAINSLPSGGGIQRGNIGGMNNGLLSERRPFLIITRPIQVLPSNYQDMEGYTTSIFTTLGALESGFVQCESVDSSGLDVTASEKEEIVKLLQGGVFI